MTSKYSKEELSNLSGAYALDALDTDEARAFEDELAAEQTRYEVTELRDTAVLLGLAVAPVKPSASLKASLMAQIATTPQLAEEESDHEISRDDTPLEFQRPASRASAKANARWFARPAVLLTAVAAAVALVFGGVATYNGVSTSQHNAAMADKFAQISTADDSEKILTPVDGGGKATVMWSSQLSSAAVKVDGVKALASDKVYELWYIDASGARAAGTFRADDGSALRVLDGTMKKGDTIGVTVEPDGGSAKPTTKPIVVVPTA